MKLIKTKDKFILVSDEEIKEGDWYFDSTDKEGLYPIYQRTQDPKFYSGCKLIIAGIPSLPEIDFSLLSEEDCKKIGWVDVEKLATDYGNIFSLEGGHRNYAAQGWLDGFKTAQSLNDKMFSLEDVVSILDDIQKDLADYQNEIGIGMMDDKQWQQIFVDRVIASITSYEQLSLQQTSWDVEVETECGYGDECPSEGAYDKQHLCKIQPKITNNSNKIIRIL